MNCVCYIITSSLLLSVCPLGASAAASDRNKVDRNTDLGREIHRYVSRLTEPASPRSVGLVNTFLRRGITAKEEFDEFRDTIIKRGLLSNAQEALLILRDMPFDQTDPLSKALTDCSERRKKWRRDNKEVEKMLNKIQEEQKADGFAKLEDAKKALMEQANPKVKECITAVIQKRGITTVGTLFDHLIVDTSIDQSTKFGYYLHHHVAALQRPASPRSILLVNRFLAAATQAKTTVFKYREKLTTTDPEREKFKKWFEIEDNLPAFAELLTPDEKKEFEQAVNLSVQARTTYKDIIHKYYDLRDINDHAIFKYFDATQNELLTGASDRIKNIIRLVMRIYQIKTIKDFINFL